MHEPDRFEVYVYVADGKEEEDLHRYVIHHWFADRPEIATVVALLEEAKRDFTALYPDAELANFDVEIRRLTPRDVMLPDPERSRPA